MRCVITVLRHPHLGRCGRRRPRIRARRRTQIIRSGVPSSGHLCSLVAEITAATRAAQRLQGSGVGEAGCRARESTFPRKRLVKFRTRRFRGNARADTAAGRSPQGSAGAHPVSREAALSLAARDRQPRPPTASRASCRADSRAAAPCLTYRHKQNGRAMNLATQPADYLRPVFGRESAITARRCTSSVPLSPPECAAHRGR
jgi:hypothetical protein